MPKPPKNKLKKAPTPICDMAQWPMAPTHPRTRRAALAALFVVGPCPTKGGCADERRLLRRVSWIALDAALAFAASGALRAAPYRPRLPAPTPTPQPPYPTYQPPVQE